MSTCATFCVVTGKKIPSSVVFCPHCGQKTQTQIQTGQPDDTDDLNTDSSPIKEISARDFNSRPLLPSPRPVSLPTPRLSLTPALEVAQQRAKAIENDRGKDKIVTSKFGLDPRGSIKKEPRNIELWTWEEGLSPLRLVNAGKQILVDPTERVYN